MLYKRHEKLNANDFFNNRNGIAKPLYRYTTLGATLGGPVPGGLARQAVLLLLVRELGHDACRSRSGRVTVPTALERKGDFSQSVNQSGAADRRPRSDHRAAVPGQHDSRRPVSTRTAWRCSNVFPLPNALDRAITGGNYNYQFQESLEVPRHQHLVRIDVRPDGEGRALRRVSTLVRRQPGLRGAGRRRQLGAARPALHASTTTSLIGNYTRIAAARRW